MELILYDTEYTSWEGSLERLWSGKGEERELVQISAILIKNLDSFHGTEFFSIYTKPQINPILSDYFVNLTGINQRYIEKFGVSIKEGLEIFSEFSSKKVCLCWGDDMQVLERNIKIHNLEVKLDVNKNIDLRNLFKKFGINTENYNSGNIESFSELRTFIKSGSEHNALSDCISMLSGIIKLRTQYGEDLFNLHLNSLIK